MTFILSNRHRRLSHILFWLGYLAYFSLQYGYVRSDYLQSFLQQCVFLPVILAAVYFNIYFLIPKYLLTKKYKQFFPYFFSSAFIFVTALRVITKYISPALFFSPEIQAQYAAIPLFHPLYILSHTFTIYSTVFIAAFIKLVKQWFADQQKHQKLVQEKLEAELKYLKAQINPHVLFNLLNNLYGLSLAGSKETPGMILKLSSLLNYMLYECNSTYIQLDKEVTLLRDFIALEKLRYGERLELNFTINGNTAGVKIAPLILFPIVENSFKHGVGKEIENSWINIDLTVNDKELFFVVSNNKSEDVEESGNNNGIGLKNIKRQLELLYDDKFNLEINDNNSKFIVKLTLQYNGTDNEN